VRACVLGFSGVVGLLAGCSTGRESVLFITKTSFGLDADTKPPALDVGYARKEGTLSPAFTNGVVLPQMASFASRGSVPGTAIGQSFATGNAAELLARYFTHTNDFANPGPITTNQITGQAVVNTGGGRPRRYFFGTDTSFAVRMTFGPETGYWPDSLSIGWKRKELAFVPVHTFATNDSGAWTTNAALPSLLGTAGLSVQAAGRTNAGIGYSQFFATGKAADALVAQRAIRDTIGLRIINDREVQEEALKARMHREGKAFRSQADLFDEIKARYQAERDPARRELIRKKSAQLELSPPDAADARFTNTLSDAVDRQNPDVTRRFQALLEFIHSLP
jgi:hypothetical protein